MITASKRVGRPKGKKQPVSQQDMYRKAMEKVAKEGGTRLNSILRGDEVAAIERFKNAYGIKKEISHAQVLKIMLLIIDGKEYQMTGATLTAHVSKMTKQDE